MITIAVTDSAIRVMEVRGNRILRWDSAVLPPGVVQGGSIHRQDLFRQVLTKTIGGMRDENTIKGADVAFVMAGRNEGEARFTLVST
ncbi:MAG: hypothetical protein QGF59_04030, partial [Pirellulaceae bacterium]|nr:hypothetical protein [Pirellulaceae bacterium]